MVAWKIPNCKRKSAKFQIIWGDPVEEYLKQKKKINGRKKNKALPKGSAKAFI